MKTTTRLLCIIAVCVCSATILPAQLMAQIPGLGNIGGRIQKGIEQEILKKLAQQNAALQEKNRQAEMAPLVSFNTGRRYALLIPVEQSDSVEVRLPNLLRLAKDLKQQLVEGGFAASDVEIPGLPARGSIDTPERNSQTIARIQTAIERLLNNVKQDDMLMIYLMGHGFGIKSDDEFHNYFCAANTPASAITSKELADKDALSITALIEQLRTCKAQEKVLVIDACQTGDLNEAVRTGISIAPPTRQRGDVWVVTSCRPNQASWILDCDGHLFPVFSWNFTRAISWMDGYDNDGDGFITLREAFNKARYATVTRRDADLRASGYDLEAEEIENDRQEPVIYVGPGLMPLVEWKSGLPATQVVSGSLDEELRITAASLARSAARIHQQAEEVYTTKFASRSATSQPAQQRPDLKPLPEDGYGLLTGYAIGGHLRAAQQLSGNTRDELLFFARHYRSTGQYARALEAYKNAGIEELEVFANGRIPSTEMIYGGSEFKQGAEFLDVTNQENPATALLQVAPGFSLDALKKHIGSVPLSTEPGGPEVGELPASTRLYISEVVTPPGSEIDWLRIARSELQQDSTAGRWIKASDVHWCREASLLFVDGSDLQNELASIIGSQLRNAEIVLTGPSLQGEVAKLRDVQRRLLKLHRILSRIPWTTQAASWIGFAEGIVSMVANSKARDVRNSYQRYQTTRAYPIERKELELGKIVQMFEVESETQAISREKLRVRNSPWARSNP